MKSEGQVRQKLKQVLFRHLQKRLRQVFRRRSDNCFHNRQNDQGPGLPVVGVCMFAGQENRLCDGRMRGSLDPKTCPYWEPLRGKEDVKAEFRDLIESPDRGRIANEYPDVAALLWVLDDGGHDAVSEVLQDVEVEKGLGEEEP